MKNLINRDFYKSNHTTEIATVSQYGIEVIANLDHLTAVGFRGKKQKPSFFHKFKSEESLREWVSKWVESTKAKLDAHENYKRERKEKEAQIRKETFENISIGDILHASWGYDQTNNDFYQVVGKVGSCFLELREVASEYIEEGWCSGKRRAIPDRFIGETIKRKVSYKGVNIDSIRYASKCAPDQWFMDTSYA